jgi:4-hydroxy-3-methylbut-2-enyl diphosphate reductase
MKVIRADSLGMCSGVRRALRMVEQALAEHPGTPVYTLGPLVHNARLVKDLSEKGVRPIELPLGAREGILVIRSHGIAPAARLECEGSGLRCIDATCPKVRRIHEAVLAHAAKGFGVLVAGEPGHPEVEGILGHARGARVVADLDDARSVPLDGPMLVVGQTTLARDAYAAICGVLRARKSGILVMESICEATESRRESLRRLAESVDALLVIGSAHSANTRWLFNAARATGRPAWQIEGVAEIPPGISAFEVVGLSAGASTPDILIDEVEAALRGVSAAAQ